MKYFLIFFAVLLSVSAIHAYALLAYYTVEDLAKVSKYIIMGKVIDIKPTIPDEKATQLDDLSVFLYDVTIKVENELKAQYTNDTIKFRIMNDRIIGSFSRSVEDSEKFEVGERVLVFLADKEPESVWGDSYYVAGTVLGKYVITDGLAYGFEYPDGIDVSELLVKIEKSSFQYPKNKTIKQMSPLKQFKSGIPLDEIKCKEGFLVVIKSSNNMPACVKPETKQKLIQRGWGIYQSQYHNSIEVILKDGTKSFVTYDISNGIVKEVRPSIPDRSLVVEIEGYGDGIFDITIPRGLVDAKLGDEKSAEDDSFFVLINGSEVTFKEKPPNEVFRSLSIPFSKGASEIEILGTFNSGCC